MKAVVMECSVRVCATPSTCDKFVVGATSIASTMFPDPPVKYSRALQPVTSRLLQRQWRSVNDLEIGTPECWDVRFAYADSSGRLTAAKLESASRDVLTALELAEDVGRETVPWILTLTTAPDLPARREIYRHHPALDDSASTIRSLSTDLIPG